MITTAEDAICPNCNEKMQMRDTKKRMIKDIVGEEYIFRLRRYRCLNCKKIHTELPDIIAERKRYSKNAIKMATSGKCDYYIMDSSTIYRWKKQNTPVMQ